MNKKINYKYVLNKIFTGSFLNYNLGHEIINFIKMDDNNRYIYLNPWGERCAESILYDYNRYYGLDVRVARIFNTYGPYMNSDDGRVIVQFIINQSKDKDLKKLKEEVKQKTDKLVEDITQTKMASLLQQLKA